MGLPPLKLKAGLLRHTAAKLDMLTVGRAFTTTVLLALSVQLLVLVWVNHNTWLPTPAVDGLKLPELTPVPL